MTPSSELGRSTARGHDPVGPLGTSLSLREDGVRGLAQASYRRQRTVLLGRRPVSRGGQEET
jgi:hypothetical protein